MKELQNAKVRHWLAEPMGRDVAEAIAKLAEADDVAQIAVMPDVHLAKEVCVGLAVATRTKIYPAAVGADIGCGMAAIRSSASAELLAEERSAARLLAGLYERAPSLKHRRATAPATLPESLLQSPLSHPRLEKLKLRDARLQLGSLGRGNHFLEFQRDDEGRLWLMVHSGSRGMGQAISAHHAALAIRETSIKGPSWFDADSPRGRDYLADAAWAEQYAAENRLAMLAAVAELLWDLFAVELDFGSLIHANHNHVRFETCGPGNLWVHRKGALSARAGEPGVIPGSMGTASFHTLGRGLPESLCSSSHGAGRALSRSEAVKKIGERQLTREMRGVWFNERQAGKLRDEAPSAYKNIFAVMRAQRELTQVVRRLQPVLNYKAV
ncbi:MAG TPA: RtcB family protein [Pirellulales bacterium]|nr:RtcB family protein [Pirellulales bacterium]